MYEVNLNTSQKKAFNLNTLVSTDYDPDVQDSISIPHASAYSQYITPEGGTTDWYSFTLYAEALVAIDIDNGAPDMDSYIKLYQGTQLLQHSDDSPTDPGSFSPNSEGVTLDSSITTYLSAGTYYVQVGTYSPDGSPVPISSGMDYQINVSSDGLAQWAATQSGGKGNDGLTGDRAHASTADTLYGNGGNDTLSGLAGPDHLYGGAGNDILYGGYGNDSLYGDAGTDYLYGEAGNDSLYGGTGDDWLDGGDGSDTAYYTGNFSDYNITIDVNGNVVQIIDGRNNGPRNEGEDTLASVEQLSFNDGTLFNGHLYQYVSDAKTFDAAKADAQSQGGYLATVTSAGENDLLLKLMMDTGISGGGGWLGGSDAAVEGDWRWIDGDENDALFWQDGSATPGYYSNWKWGEPNDINIGEDYLMMYASGQWNDTGGPYEPNLKAGYFVEKDVSSALQLVSSAGSFASPTDTGAGTVDTNLFGQSF